MFGIINRGVPAQTVGVPKSSGFLRKFPFRMLLSLAFAHGFCSGLARADSPSVGRVQWVIDGDTVQISHAGAPEGEPVRARHFDTPEKGSRAHCESERNRAGQATALARSLLPRGSRVGLADFGRDRYGRLLAKLTLADGRDLAAVMIEAGLAQPYTGGHKPDWCAERWGSRPTPGQWASAGLSPDGGGSIPRKSAARIAAAPSGFREVPPASAAP